MRSKLTWIFAASWEFFLQDVVKRSQTLAFISVVAAFTCSRMRVDGFGGMATVITADAIRRKSTNDLIEDFLLGTGLDGGAAGDHARKLRDAASCGGGRQPRAHGMHGRGNRRIALRHVCGWSRRSQFPIYVFRPSR
jgi:hypothetical protein